MAAGQCDISEHALPVTVMWVVNKCQSNGKELHQDSSALPV